MTFTDRIQEQYTGMQGQKYHATLNTVPDNAYPWVARTRARKMAPFVAAQHTVLEYGAGTGWNLAALTCRRRLGYDIAPHIAPLLKRYQIVYIDRLDHIAEQSIDVVICHHVLEHTPNPPQVLCQIWHLLVKGGRLLLYVPYEKEARYRLYNPQEPNLHLYSWNVQTLGNLVRHSNFRLLKAQLNRFGYDRFAATWASHLHLGEIGFRLLQRGLHAIKPAWEIGLVAEKV